MEIINFFNPKTLAIVGASDNLDKVGGILFTKAMKSNCEIIPINPKYDSLLGVRCYGDIQNFKGKIDLVVIAIPSQFVVSELIKCGKKGVKSVIVVSAGFSEVGNHELEKKVLEIASKYGIRVLGPNCFGVFSSSRNLDLTFSATTPGRSKIAFVSQSGALWSYLADAYKEIGFSKFVGLGNMSDLEFNDFIDYLGEDRDTDSIILYIEKLKKGREFIEICKKVLKKGKKIYAVKAGSSKEGSKAAFSHTGSLATDYEVYRGAFKQAGVILCKTPEEAFEMASGKKTIVPSSKNKINIMKKAKIITNAGGVGVLISDYLEEKGIEVLESRDIIGTALAKDYQNTLENLIDFEGTIVIALTSQSMTEILETAEVVVNFRKQTGKHIVALFLGKSIIEKAYNLFEINNINHFEDFESFRMSI